MKMNTKEIIIISVIVILFSSLIVVENINQKLKKKIVKILFKNEEITGTNIGPGECVFTIKEQKYYLSINTKHTLKYVDMNIISSKDSLPKEKDVWYRIWEITSKLEANDPVRLEFSPIEKEAPSCDQRIATITKITKN